MELFIHLENATTKRLLENLQMDKEFHGPMIKLSGFLFNATKYTEHNHKEDKLSLGINHRQQPRKRFNMAAKFLHFLFWSIAKLS